MPRAVLQPSPASATPSQRQCVSGATSANDSFEIRPASKPDMENIPEGDLHARALASLRVNSRNSFVFLPKPKPSGACASVGRQPVEQPKAGPGWASPSHEPGAQLVPEADGLPACQRHPLGAEAAWAVEEGGCPRQATALQDQASRWPRPSSPPPPALPGAAEAEPAQGLQALGLARTDRELGASGLPVTFIDEVASDEEISREAKTPPWSGPHPTAPEPGPKPHGGTTFLVVPKRKPGSPEEPRLSHISGETWPREVEKEEEEEEEEEEEAGSAMGSHGCPGTRSKKRYPAAHEIEVIGGYMALQKSCLTKARDLRKKMKISFNDKSLQTTFEYPSESSLLQEPEEDAESEGSEGVAEEKAFAFFLPRASFVPSLGPDSSSGLSSYTPKHTVAFSKWQELRAEPTPSAAAAEPLPKEVMLTPADQSGLSDFRSEPALYF